MADKIHLEIVTPRGPALRADVDEVTAPGAAGEFGVLPGHLPLLAALRTGLVSYRQGGETKRCAVGSGFAEADTGKLVILTDHYVERAQIDPVVVRKELAEVQAEIAKAETKSAAMASQKARPSVLVQADNELRLMVSADDLAPEELKLLISKENWLAAQLELYGDPPPATMRPFEEWGPPPPPPEEEVPDEDADAKSGPSK